MNQRRLGVLAGVLSIVAVAAIWRAVEPTKNALRALHACDAQARQDWPEVLAASASLPATGHADAQLLDAVECRCDALEATGRPQDCDTLLDDWLLRPGADDWLPADPRLMRWMVHAGGQGHVGDAAVVAERRRKRDPADPAWTFRAFSITLSAGDESRAFTELSRLLPTLSGPAAVAARTVLANSAHHRGEYLAEYTLLLEGQAPAPQPAFNEWYYALVAAAANTADVERTRDAAKRWADAGGNPGVVACGYAAAMSSSSLKDPDKGWTELLEAAVATPGADTDTERLGQAYSRLIGHVALDGNPARALEYTAEAKRRVPDFEGNEGELARMAKRQHGAADETSGALTFASPGAPGDAELWVSPDRGSSPESVWTKVALESGQGTVRRTLDATPVRWVLRSETTTYASGTTWPAPGSPVTIPVAVEKPVPRASVADLAPGRPADGKRRVWVVILDCGDWRVTSYLRQRGEMPNWDALLRSGWRAAPYQLPAFTAAAMDALSHPVPRASATVGARVHELGIELAGLSSIGKNPFAALEFVLPSQKSLFDTLGAGELRAANLLFSHGNIDAGRNAEVAGPQGAHSVLPLGRSSRPLSSAELAAFPELGMNGEYAVISTSMQTMAAQFDTIGTLMSGGEVDAMFFRVEGLDPITHGGFAATTEARQDEGHARLFSVYRYIDRRLGEVARGMDGDDMLIVMSDHGIETSMMHHPVALFLAWGNGVPTGRLKGRPAVRGVSRAVAELLGVQTDWPDYGILPWAAQWRAGAPISQTTADATLPSGPSAPTPAAPTPGAPR